MALYKYIRDTFRSDSDEHTQQERERLISWRKEPVRVRIERPTRLDRARSLGYRAKQGIIIVRQRLGRGGHQRERTWGGRRSKNTSMRVELSSNYRQIAEQRVSRAFHNLVVLNSYEAARDGKNVWYEVILIDPASPSVLADPSLRSLALSPVRGRAARGITMAGRRGRGLMSKGMGAEKVRPSRTANWKRRNPLYVAKYRRRYL